MINIDGSAQSRVEELNNFPFSNYAEFTKKVWDKEASVKINANIALQSIEYDFSKKSNIIKLLCWMTFIIAIILIICAIITKIWLLLLGIPIIPIFTFLFNPVGRIAYPSCLLRVLTILNWACLLWGLIKGIIWLIVIPLAIIIAVFSQNKAYKLAVDNAYWAVMSEESFLCYLWENNYLSIVYKGNIYRTDRFE